MSKRERGAFFSKRQLLSSKKASDWIWPCFRALESCVSSHFERCRVCRAPGASQALSTRMRAPQRESTATAEEKERAPTSASSASPMFFRPSTTTPKTLSTYRRRAVDGVLLELLGHVDGLDGGLALFHFFEWSFFEWERKRKGEDSKNKMKSEVFFWKSKRLTFFVRFDDCSTAAAAKKKKTHRKNDALLLRLLRCTPHARLGECLYSVPCEREGRFELWSSLKRVHQLSRPPLFRKLTIALTRPLLFLDPSSFPLSLSL